MIRKVLGVAMAVGSILRSIILNVLGAGGLIALKSLIENGHPNRILKLIFSPLYYISLVGLAIWQIFDFTLFSKKSYETAITQPDEDVSPIEIARCYPIHFLYNIRKDYSSKANEEPKPSEVELGAAVDIELGKANAPTT